MTETAQVRKISSRRSRGSQGAAGQLDRYDDGTWEFFGNGTTTTADVAENIINYERRENNPDYERIKPDALAQLLLDSDENKALKRLVAGDVRKPIPTSQTFLADGDTLKQLVGMLMAHEKELRATLLAQDVGDKKDKTSQVLGTVRGGGLSLPYEP